MTVTDEDYLLRAYDLAVKGLGHTRPNPAVGAVVVKGGRVIGQGWHRRCGGCHAEVAAIENCRTSPAGATIYVTLEPCSKPGRVGACTDAIVAAGIRRVVYAVADPNPANRGKAKRALARHGISCERADAKSDAVNLCEELVRAFGKHVTTGLPFVTVKLAMSLDGKICDNWGGARWISCEASRKFTGRWRETVDAVMVGAETVRRDNPSLLSHGRENGDLLRVVVSKSGNLPKSSQVFADGKNRTLVFNDARQAVRELGKMGITHVLCEGGLRLATSLAEAGLVDEWVTVLAPVVIGNRRIERAIRGFAPTFATWPGMTDSLCLFEKGHDWRKNKRRLNRGGLMCLPD